MSALQSTAREPAPLFVESAHAAWDDIRADIVRHWFWCPACRPTVMVCSEGQGLAELERSAWSLVRRARALTGV